MSKGRNINVNRITLQNLKQVADDWLGIVNIISIAEVPGLQNSYLFKFFKVSIKSD